MFDLVLLVVVVAFLGVGSLGAIYYGSMMLRLDRAVGDEVTRPEPTPERLARAIGGMRRS